MTVTDTASPTPKTASQTYNLIVGQQYVISTVAGAPPPTPLPAINASLGSVGAAARDGSGNLFFITLSSVFKIDLTGTLTRLAGTGRPGYSGDGGPAVNAQLNSPNAIALDQAGNIYIADGGRIRKISTTGIITSVAGTGIRGYSGDGGPALLAQVAPSGLAVDSSNNIFFSDSNNNRIRKVAVSGTVTTVAGTGASGYSGDGGPATTASLKDPQGLAFDSAGNLYFSDTLNGVVREVSTGGVISTFAGTGTPGSSGDGGALTTQLNLPGAMAIDSNNNVYFAGVGGFFVISQGRITNVPNQQGATAGMAVDAAGNIYSSLGLGSTLAQISPTGVATILAGNHQNLTSGDGGPAIIAQLSPIGDVMASPGGGFYVSAHQGFFFDSVYRVRRVDSSGNISTLAVTGQNTITGQSYGLALDASGNVYSADFFGETVEKINPAGAITTAAGNGTSGSSGDGGLATLAEIDTPRKLAVDGIGNLYIADAGNYRVRMVSPAGIISTVAGNGTLGYSGDGGLATAAELSNPSGLAVDSSGNLYIADLYSNVVRKVTPAGVISTFATGLQQPYALTVDSGGNLTVALTNTLNQISPSGIVTPIAGNGVAADSGDGGPATAASFSFVAGVSTDGLGNIYVADSGSNTIRVLKPSTAPALNLSAATLPPGISGTAYQATTLAISGGTPPYTVSATALPPGLALDAGTGAITGTPNTLGTWDFTVTLTDSGTVALTAAPAQVVSQNYRITVTGPPPVLSSVSPNTSPVNDPTIGVNVTGTNIDVGATILFTPPGGAPTQLFAVIPTQTGLSGLIESSLLSTAGTAQVAVMNPSGVTSASLPFTISPLTISSASPNTASPGSGSTSLTVNGQYFNSNAVVQWTAPNGTTVQITPSLIQAAQLAATIPAVLLSTAGTAQIAISEPGSTLSNSLAFTIAPALSIQTSAIPAVVTGNTYLAQLSATGGTGAYRWSAPANSLPAGLTLDASTGAISGIPTASGLFPLTVTVTDSATPTPTTAVQTYSLLVGQQYVISTVAGGVPPPTPVPATSASLDSTGAVARDASGNIYFIAGNAIFKVDQSGVLTLIAGTGRQGYSGDGGPATQAQLNAPSFLAVDASGSVYESENDRIRKITAAGTITTFAGNGIATPFSGDGGPAVNAQLAPGPLAVDSSGALFVIDDANLRVRKIALDGTISTIAGNGAYGNTGDGGPATSASFEGPSGIAVDGAENIYIADSDAKVIRKVSPAGTISRIAGVGTTGNGALGNGGPALAATLDNPEALALDGANDLYFEDGSTLRVISPDGIINSLPGLSFAEYGFAIDGSGNVYAPNENYQVVVSSSAGVVTVLAGNGNPAYGGDGGPAAPAQLSEPFGVALDGSGNIFIADRDANRIRKIASGGVITTVAGNGTPGYSGDGGPGTSAELNSPAGITLDSAGNLYIADCGNNRVRVLSTAGVITTAAGNGVGGLSGDSGRATAAELSCPTAVALDGSGNLYIADLYNSSIRLVSPAGIITTVAGNGTAGVSGDGGPATAAEVAYPEAIAIDGQGDILIGDVGTKSIRKVAPGGIITTFASASNGLVNPQALAVDRAGNVFAGGILNSGARLQQVSPAGAVTNIAGNGTSGYSGDGGGALSAALQQVSGIGLDSAGNIYFADSGNALFSDVEPYPALNANAEFIGALRVLRPAAAAPLNINTSALPNGTTTSWPATTLTANGGIPPYTWSVTALPPGLALGASSGAITGTPTRGGTYDFSVTVTDSGTAASTGAPAQTASQNYQISIAAPPVTITSVAPHVAPVGSPAASVVIAGTNFDANTTVLFVSPGGQEALISPSLIQAAQLAATIPANLFSTAGTAQIAISEPGSTQSNALPFTIFAPIVVTTTALPTGQTLKPYSSPLAASGGIPPYTGWTVSAGSLPQGLTLNPSTGAITGTPAAAASGTFNFSVTVNDSTGATSTAQSESLTIFVNTTITLSGPAKSPNYGQPVTLTATVTPSNVAGKVTFYDRPTVLGIGTLSSGQATFTTSLLPADSNSLAARYSGNATFAPSLSAPLPETVNALPGSGFQPALVTSFGANATSAAVADFNGDGRPDIALPGYSANNVVVRLGKGDGTFLAATSYPVGDEPLSVATGDFNGDGNTDIAVLGLNGLNVLLGNGDGTFMPALSYGGISFPRVLAAGDFNGDGKVDLALLSDGEYGIVEVLPGNGDGTFQPGVQYSAGPYSYSLALGDFNGDGIADLAVGGMYGTINILLGNGDGSFMPPVSYPVGNVSVTEIAVKDFNGDGKADLALAGGPYYGPAPGTALTVLLGNGDGTFQPATAYGTGDSSLTVATSDFNSDGIPDLALTNGAPNLELEILLGNGDGTFQPPISYLSVSGSVLAVNDFNGDGRADILNLGASSNLDVFLGAIPEPAVLCPAATTPILTTATYTLNCAASAGVGPYTWAITTGALPAGLTLNTATGAITGTPTATGSFSFTIQATDSDTPPQTATQNVTLVIATQLKLTASPLPAGTAGSSYSGMVATGGTTPYTCSVSAGTLPAGITLTSATCALSGSPSAAATYTFTIAASDSGTPAQTASQAYSLTVNAAAPVTPAGPSSPPVTPVVVPVTITTTAIPNGALGVPYTSFLITATGASGVFTFSSTNLPAGLSISAEGQITGTPQAAGVFAGVVITATDAHGFGTGSATFTITITGGLTISGKATIPEIALGGTVSVIYTATGGQTPYTWSASGLPSGLSINSATGALTGTPAQPGNYSLSIDVVDSTKASAGPFAVTLSVLGITTAAQLPTASPTTAYSQSFSAAGGSSPYTFTASAVPTGMTLTASGVLSGLAKTPGTYSLNVTVTDANKFSASSTFTLVVTSPGPLTVSNAALPNGTVGVPYSATLAASGGAPAYSWTVTSGSLPGGLSLTSAGTISGTPSRAATFAFTVTATDTSAGTASAAMSISILPAPLKLTTSSLPNAIQGFGYPAQILAASGGTAPYTFAVSSGQLPPGITLSGGQAGGNPSQAGTFDFTVTVTDSATPPVTAGGPLEIVVKPSQAGLILSSAALSFSLTTGASALPGSSGITVQSSVVSQLLNYSVAANPAVAWLDITSGTATGSTTPGNIGIALDPSALSLAASASPYQTSIVVTCVAPSPCAGSAQTVVVSLSVSAPPPQLSVSTSLLSLSTTASSPVTGTFGIQNTGGGTLQITSVTAADGWASISGVPASLTSGPPQQITVTANPAGLSAGYYLTTVTVVSSAGPADIPVGLLIAQNLSMNLNPAGAQFQAQAGSAPGATTGSFLLSVSGTSSISWSAAVLSGANWLSVTTPSGTASGATPGMVSFAIDPVAAAALAAPASYGTIQVSSPDIVNSPQNFEVVLNIVPASDGISPDPTPAGLVFIANGAAAIPPQIVQVLAGSAAPIPYQASIFTTDGASWLSVNPGTGATSSVSPGQSSVSANPAGLTPGVYRGGVSYAFSSSAVRTVNVTLIVQEAPGAESAARLSLTSTSPASACTPTSLVPTQTGLLDNFAQSAGLPVPLSLFLVNDCGAPVLNAHVGVDFSNGDPSLTLIPVGSSGVYWSTWTPLASSSQAIVSSRASAPGFATATTQVAGQISSSSIPTLTDGGTVHAFNPIPGAALSPGTIVEIYGSNLSTQILSASTVPLPVSLGGTSVTIGGIQAPLYYVSPLQINAQVPFELAAGRMYQVVVASANGQSTPDSFATAAVSPGIAAYANGAVIAQHADYSLVTESSPARPGEAIIFYLLGLGSTSNPAPSGTASPVSPLAQALNMPTLTLNGETVPVAFAGLTPGSVGLYQINFLVPLDVPNGDLPLLISQGGTSANPTVLPVHN